MSSIVITLASTLLQGGGIDLELPADVPLQSLLPVLVRELQIASTDRAGQPITYQLIHHRRQRSLQGSETFRSAGVATGDILSLSGVGAQAPDRTKVVGRGPEASALLRCESGAVIALDNYGKPELSVGRYNSRTGECPDIDLSEERAGSTVSRTHALLRKQGSGWALVPLSTKNPTRVGNTRVSPQQSRLLESGDVIALGGVQLVFESGRRS
jgi:uncharacterized ubiquitin-like protein YukD